MHLPPAISESTSQFVPFPDSRRPAPSGRQGSRQPCSRGPSIYDVAIVGAGPSGAFLAHLLAKSGRTVALIDKSAFPRDKVCGGGISHKTIALLEPEFDITPVIQQRTTGAFLAYKNEDHVEKTLMERGDASVLRSDFDNLILQQATASGATFIPQCAFLDVSQRGEVIAIKTSNSEIRSRYLIGADGVFSQVRKKVFGSDLVTYAPAVEALVHVPQQELAKYRERVLFDFGGMSNGYGWIFPKNDHLNVGVFSVFKTRHASLRDQLAVFMALYKSLSRYTRIEHKGSCIPLRNTRALYQDRNIWLIGDAAGFAESVYGEGIYFALQSAVVACRALTSAEGAAGASAYHAALESSQMLTDMRFSEMNAKLVFRFPRLGFYRMVRNASVNNLFAELIAGGIGHRECFVRTLLTSPYWLSFKSDVSDTRPLSL